MSALDSYLERRIDRAALELQTATTAAARRIAYNRLQDLVKRRNTSRVAEMEQAKGLR